VSLAIGAGGLVAFLGVATPVLLASANFGLALVAGRAVHFALGGLLAYLQRDHVRGHTFLGGILFPLRASYAVAIVALLALPSRVVLLLMGMPYGG
jgi:hypothetical protein